MARTFRRHRQTAPISELNLTNLIDLGFTLLIIFMIATPLIQQEQTIPVNLPAESKSPQAKAEPGTTFESITIDRAGNLFVGARGVSMGQLEGLLDDWAARPKQPVIRIRADGEIAYRRVIELLDGLKRRNLSRITFDTQARD